MDMPYGKITRELTLRWAYKSSLIIKMIEKELFRNYE